MKSTLAILLLCLSPALFAEEKAKAILASNLSFGTTLSTGIVDHEFKVDSIMTSLKSHNTKPMIEIFTDSKIDEITDEEVEFPTGTFDMYSEVVLEFPTLVPGQDSGKDKIYEITKVEVDPNQTFIYHDKNRLCEVTLRPESFNNSGKSVKYQLSVAASNKLLGDHTIKNALQSEFDGVIDPTEEDMVKINQCIRNAFIAGGILLKIKLPANLVLRDKSNQVKILKSTGSRQSRTRQETGALPQ